MYKILSTCKGGGYMYCRTEPPHPRRNSKGLYPLHRVLMENKIGRDLLTTEHVHHKDEDKTNNDIENLEILTVEEHARHHQKIDVLELICPNCETGFTMKPHIYRQRSKRNKTGQVFCSRSCGSSV